MRAIGNLPDKDPLRWSLNKAARELGCTEYLLGKCLKDAGETADSGGCWSTGQLIKAMFGNLHFEQLRRTRAEADGRELQNSILRSEYLPRSELERVFGEIAGAMKQIVKASDLAPASQADFLRSLAAIPVTFKAIGAHQRNGANGELSGARKRKPKKETASKGTASGE